MKPRLLLIIVPLLASTPVAQAQLRAKAPTRDAATHEELSERMKAAGDPINKPKPVVPADQAKPWQPVDLLARSQVISCRGMATLVPKGAVLHVPSNCQGRFEMAEGDRLATWADFFTANRGWILCHEVTREQAEGKIPFDPAITESFKKSPCLIVATMKGGPISMLPPKKPAEATSVADQNQAKPTR